MEKIEVLRKLHQQGLPLKAIGHALGGMSVEEVSSLAIKNGLRRKPIIPQEKREEIRDLADAYTIREIAKRVGCSRSQAGHWVIFWREREAAKRGELATRRLNAPRRCPVHGPLKIWPCVACAAEAANPDGIRAGT